MRSPRAVDFGRTARDYGRWRAGFPARFFERLQALGVCVAGTRVLDLATGVGAVARELARRGCRVTALDRSEELVREADRLAGEEGLSIHFVHAPAEGTGEPDEAYDAVTAGQCWHWFDRPRVAAEARRVLVPGGALVVAHFDWIPLPGNMAETTERLISVYNPGGTLGDGTGLYPQWLRDLTLAGFQDLESFSFDSLVPYTQEAWRGRVRASAAVGASLPEDETEAFDRDLRRLLEQKYADPFEVPHRVWTVVARRPGA